MNSRASPRLRRQGLVPRRGVLRMVLSRAALAVLVSAGGVVCAPAISAAQIGELLRRAAEQSRTHNGASSDEALAISTCLTPGPCNFARKYSGTIEYTSNFTVSNEREQVSEVFRFTLTLDRGDVRCQGSQQRREERRDPGRNVELVGRSSGEGTVSGAGKLWVGREMLRATSGEFALYGGCPFPDMHITTTRFDERGSRTETTTLEGGEAWQIDIQPTYAADLSRLVGTRTFEEEEGGTVITIAWDLVLDGAVRADPGGPYRASRGEIVELDGSRSVGGSHEWRFSPRDCPAGAGGDPAAVLRGARPQVRMLCSMRVTLTVSNSGQSDTGTTEISITPRDWTTPFEHLAEEGVLEREGLRPVIKRLAGAGGAEEFEGRFIGGENVSASDPGRSAQESLEPFAEEGTWDGRGYSLEQVADGGPFQNYWYVADYHLKVQRQTLLNPYLLPNGPPVMGTSFYAKNRELNTDIDAYLAGIRAHEGIADGAGRPGHSGLLRDELASRDPAREVEGMFAPGDRAALRTRIDDLLKDVDHQLCDASKDPIPHVVFRGNVAFPYDDWTGWKVAWVEVGGANYYGHMEACRRRD